MSSSLFDLTGKSALITGSSQGIGFALAKGLAASGAKIILNGRDRTKLQAAADNLSTTGADVQTLGYDCPQSR
jgi:gluconate 5-dehydrogenase